MASWEPSSTTFPSATPPVQAELICEKPIGEATQMCGGSHSGNTESHGLVDAI
jgi:hypothetical protein